MAFEQSERWTETPRPWVTKPDDLVARHRRAAPGQVDHDVVEALDVDARGGAPARARAADPQRGRGRELLLFPAPQLPGQPLHDRLADDTWCSPIAAYRASRSARFIDVGHRAQGGRARAPSGAACPPRRSALVSSSRPVLDGVLAAFPAEPLADLVAGPRRGDHLQPVARRPGRGRLRGEDLDRVGRRQAWCRAARAARSPGRRCSGGRPRCGWRRRSRPGVDWAGRAITRPFGVKT